MNTTTYRKRIPSPLHPVQVMRKQAFNIRDPKHPGRTAIQKCIGRFDLTAIVEEDDRTLATMKHVDGLISFLCTLVKDGQVIAQGSGSALLSPSQRYVERAVRSAFFSSVADAALKATKVLGTFHASAGEDVEDMYVSSEFEPATEKQKNYLRELIHVNIDDEDVRENTLASLEEISKTEASRMIDSYKQ